MFAPQSLVFLLNKRIFSFGGGGGEGEFFVKRNSRLFIWIYKIYMVGLSSNTVCSCCRVHGLRKYSLKQISPFSRHLEIHDC